MTSLIDTHCHIHDSEYEFIIDDVLDQAKIQKIETLICVGTDLRSSKEALSFSQTHPQCYASLGLHPHLATQSLTDLKLQFERLKELAYKFFKSKKLVAIGECGLDYFYHKDLRIRDRQKQLFRWQLDLAKELNLVLIFHIRNAFDDFWPIYEDYKLPAVIHSFSDSADQVKRGLNYENLYFGLNGIITFSKDQAQLQAAKLIPDHKLVLETDTPYLTPAPFRGKVNKPEYLRIICNFLADLRQVEADLLATQTTNNAKRLFFQ